MRRSNKAAMYAAAALCLAGNVFTMVPAKASVFDFSFGPDAFGTFTTGAAAADPGYDLITGLTFDVLKGVDSSGNSFSFTNEVGSGFSAGAAFDPTTLAFINHSAGSTYHDIGDFDVPDAFIEGISFSLNSDGVQGSIDENEFFTGDELEITPAASPVPELSTWGMMLLGFASLGFVTFRRSGKRDISVVSA